jgi:HSP20 family protein
MERRDIPAPSVWNPFREISRLEQELSKLVSEFIPVAARPEAVVPQNVIPKVDVYETKDKVIVEAELPGVDKGDIEVIIKDNSVIIRGEVKREEEQQERNFIKAERFYGKFERVIPLMVEVKPEEAVAKMENGILRLEIPKATAEKEVKINIG